MEIIFHTTLAASQVNTHLIILDISAAYTLVAGDVTLGDSRVQDLPVRKENGNAISGS
jgi:hypothetical protein